MRQSPVPFGPAWERWTQVPLELPSSAAHMLESHLSNFLKAPNMSRRHLRLAVDGVFSARDEAPPLLLQKVVAEEALSQVSRYQLTCISDAKVDVAGWIGKDAHLEIDLPQNLPPNPDVKYVHGIITSIATSAISRSLLEYRIELMAWPWLLSQRADCCIFQEMSVPDIVASILGKQDAYGVEQRLEPGVYEAWDFTVQYNESDLAFINRLMEREGMWYFFAHDDKGCTMVQGDSSPGSSGFPGYDALSFNPDEPHAEHITTWTRRMQLVTRAFALSGYSYDRPRVSLLTDARRTGEGKPLERYHYPATVETVDAGDRYARLRTQRFDCEADMASGTTTARGLSPGYAFELRDHPDDCQNGKYLVHSVNWTATNPEFFADQHGTTPTAYAAAFTAIPDELPFRAAYATPRPVINGAQTAKVTGPEGQKVYVDPQGRIKVKFHWDRRPEEDEHSSCWIRVAQHHTGVGLAADGHRFGGMDLPHIKEEVVVVFIEGNPDWPLVLGRVYNAANTPPLDLPGHKHVTVVARDMSGNEIIMYGGA